MDNFEATSSQHRAVHEHNRARYIERMQQLAQQVRLVPAFTNQIQMLDVLVDRRCHPARSIRTSGASGFQDLTSLLLDRRRCENQLSSWRRRADDCLNPIQTFVVQQSVGLIDDDGADMRRLQLLVYEPFLGSGTTLAAAELTERICYGLELDPKYVDVTVERWQQLTGKTATLEADGVRSIN